MIKSVAVSMLKEHKVNRLLYGDGEVRDLIESIEDVGLLQPITVTQDNIILSGHRRVKAVRQLGWDMIDAEVVDNIPAEADQIERLIASNVYREKTNEMKMREAKALADARPKGVRGQGATRELVGKAVGISGRSVDRGIKVIDAVDKLRENGDTKKADELVKKMNSSIYSALKEVEEPLDKEEDVGPVYYEFVHVFEDLCNRMEKSYKKLSKLRDHTTPIGLGHAIGNIMDMRARLATWLPKNRTYCEECGGTKEVNGEKCPYCIAGKSGMYKVTDK